MVKNKKKAQEAEQNPILSHLKTTWVQMVET